MMIINYFALKKRVEECGISRKNSKKTIREIRNMDSELKRDFGKWYKNGIIPTDYVEGITFETLTKTFKMNEINAFLTLDWLKREPNEAKEALGSAVDRIIISSDELSGNTEEETEDISDLNIED